MSDSAATRKLLLSVLHPAGLRFGGGVVRVRTIEPHALSPPALIELRADDVPALAQVQDAMLQSGGPALRRDADSIAHPRLSVYGRTSLCESGDQRKATKPGGQDDAQDQQRRAQSVPDRTQKDDSAADAQSEPDAPQPWSRHTWETPIGCQSSQEMSKK